MNRLFRGLSNGTLQLLVMAIGLLLLWGMLAPVGTLVWWITEGSETAERIRQRLADYTPNDIEMNNIEMDDIEPENIVINDPENSSSNRDATVLEAPPNALAKPNSAAKTSTDRLNSASSVPDFSAPSTITEINCYIIFLTGVGDYSTDQLTPGEKTFLDRLEQAQPGCVTVRDVFPYSAANQDLAAGRWLTPLWQVAEQGEGWLKNADLLIKIRNLWRFALSADDRYGSIYNQGIASAMLDRMNATHPISETQEIQIVLIGTSGGAQVALGAVPYLKDWLNVPVTVISAGGTFGGTVGFQQVDRVYHLRGDRDWVITIPNWLFPSRWPWTIGSPLNRARQQGRYQVLNSGSHSHDGEDGYFGQAIEPESQKPYVELTLQLVNQLPIWSTDLPASSYPLPPNR
jgi:hypothetical protein